MLAYTLILLPLTVMPSFFGALGHSMGLPQRCWAHGCCGTASSSSRETTAPVAWRMYRYSLLYFALLFVAMGVDRALPFGHRTNPAPMIILDRPEQELAMPTGGHHGH